MSALEVEVLRLIGEADCERSSPYEDIDPAVLAPKIVALIEEREKKIRQAAYEHETGAWNRGFDVGYAEGQRKCSK